MQLDGCVVCQSMSKPPGGRFLRMSSEQDETSVVTLCTYKRRYETEGVRRTVDAILLVGEHSHPHVLLLQVIGAAWLQFL